MIKSVNKTHSLTPGNHEITGDLPGLLLLNILNPAINFSVDRLGSGFFLDDNSLNSTNKE